MQEKLDRRERSEKAKGALPNLENFGKFKKDVWPHIQNGLTIPAPRQKEGVRTLYLGGHGL